MSEKIFHVSPSHHVEVYDHETEGDVGAENRSVCSTFGSDRPGTPNQGVETQKVSREAP